MVEGDDTPEGRGGVTVVRPLVSVGEAARGGDAAGIGVLDDRGRRHRKILDQVPGGVDVDDVVVGELDSLELSGVGDALAGGPDPVERGGLVGILTVPELLDPGAPDRVLTRPSLGGLEVARVRRDGAVVGGRVRICGRRQLPPEGKRNLPGPKPVEDRGVVDRADHHQHRSMVLGGGADHRGTADVDVLDRLLDGDPGPGDGGLEGVEVDRHQVDRRQPLGGQLLHVRGHLAVGEDAAMHPGVESLQPAVHDLGEAGEVADTMDLHARVLERLAAAAGGVDLEAELAQAAGEVGEAGLVVDREDGFHRTRLPSMKALIDCGSSRCSTAWIRSVSVFRESAAWISTASWAMTRPASMVWGSIRWMVTPVLGTRALKASSMAFMLPPNSGSSDGWTLRMRPLKAATKPSSRTRS